MRIILVLAPHTVDGEFGCGGTIGKLINQGDRVVYIVFSAAEQSELPRLPHLPRDILRKDVLFATSSLEIKKVKRAKSLILQRGY